MAGNGKFIKLYQKRRALSKATLLVMSKISLLQTVAIAVRMKGNDEMLLKPRGPLGISQIKEEWSQGQFKNT